MSQPPPRNLADELVGVLQEGRLIFGPRAILAYLRQLTTQPPRPERIWYELLPNGSLVEL